MNKRLAEDSDKTLYRSFKKKACKTHETKAENFYFFNVKMFSHIITAEKPVQQKFPHNKIISTNHKTVLN